MGNLFRRFWLPVLLKEELPEPDSAPVALRVLGEDLVAFRDSDGKVGLLEAHCAHRHAHLFWGRNEESGLRCTYHGWKYDVTGACVDMPSETDESTFKDKINVTSYPARDGGGLIWAYMGPYDLMPRELPNFEFMRVPESHVHMSKRLQLSNWAQATEGGIDSSHISYLHRSLNSLRAARADTALSGTRGPVTEQKAQQSYAAADRSPRFFLEPSEFGFWIGAQRNANEQSYYWRLTPFLLPSYTIVPGAGAGRGGHCWVPIDDEHCWAFSFGWNVERSMSEGGGGGGGGGIHSEVDKETARWDLGISNSYLPTSNKSNNYLISREDQRSLSFTGIKGVSEQDMSIQESMGAVVPRDKEHLGTTDRAIIEFRRALLSLAKDLQEGREPEIVSKPDVYDVISCAAVIGRDEHWLEGTKEFVKGRV